VEFVIVDSVAIFYPSGARAYTSASDTATATATATAAMTFQYCFNAGATGAGVVPEGRISSR
jgi:hypothetical protein